MWKLIAIIFTLIQLLKLLDAQNLARNRDYCDYSETINITSGVRLNNGDILYEGIKFTNLTYTVYNYEIVKHHRVRPTEPHLRGCLCKVKNCVRMCCPKGEIVDENEKGCRPAVPGQDLLQLLVPTVDNLTISLFNENVGFLYGKLCKITYYLTPSEDNPEDLWYYNRPVSNNYYYLA